MANNMQGLCTKYLSPAPAGIIKPLSISVNSTGQSQPGSLDICGFKPQDPDFLFFESLYMDPGGFQALPLAYC